MPGRVLHGQERRALILAGAGLCLSAVLTFGQSNTAAGNTTIGITEHLGGTVALDAPFLREDGATTTLRQLVTTPTILALVYYNCPNVCDYLLTGISGSLTSLDAEPGRDYNLVSVSIDEHESPVDARRAKRIAIETVERPFPSDAWHFLTGSLASIHAVADSVGFHYVRRGNYLDHPVGIVILSPQGKIVRYMNGAEFLPADLKLSLLEASRGKVGPTIAHFIRICFSQDPTSHALVFNTLRVVASVTLSVAALFVLYLVLATRRRKAQRSALSEGRSAPGAHRTLAGK